MNTKNNDLERIHAQLEKHTAELEQINQYKSEFLAKMSHELRTPLNGLLILSALLSENKENNLTEQQRQFAKSINNAGHDLLLLINDILDLSKIEAQKLTLRPEFFSLQDIFESIENTFKHQAESKSLNLILDLPDSIKHLKMNTDRQRLEQIIRNFISNAIKFTENGSITVKAILNESTQDIVFSVKDTGIGIPENKQKLIFEAFEQADGSVSRKYGGTGLGLTISRELSALLGGFVDLESKENDGSTFFLTIPQSLNTADEVTDRDQKTKSTRDLAEIFDKNLSSEKIQPAKSSQTITNYESEVEEILSRIPNNSRSILIVEDDADFRLSIVETVKNYDFFPIEVADGELALAILKKHIPTAILLDIKLPGISGLGILDNIKKIPQLRHIPVHMISGLEYQQNALRMGALGYLTKPVTLDKINAALKRIELLLSNSVKRILLIEDDEKQRFAISSLISGSDVEVVAATNGKVALEKIKTEGFDCIILDLTLPDMTGFDLLAQLNSISVSLPPVVIYTGQDLTDEEDKYLRQFSESIIIKGARSPERLLDEVNLFLHRIESLLPESTKEILYNLRSQEKSFEGKTVLVVDDDIRNIFALTSALEAKGLNVKVARDGLEALEVLEKNSASVNLILMDIMMPKMNGYDAIKSIRSNENVKISSLPIIALTAKAMKEDHEKCINAGANDYLPKPINIDNLVTILRIWLAPKGLFS
ncbi:MAG: response regulator [Pseudobdellovibrio sp.]